MDLCANTGSVSQTAGVTVSNITNGFRLSYSRFGRVVTPPRNQSTREQEMVQQKEFRPKQRDKALVNSSNRSWLLIAAANLCACVVPVFVLTSEIFVRINPFDAVHGVFSGEAVSAVQRLHR